jgi:protein phosphatase
LGEADILDKLVIASLSDVGRSRTENQDSFCEACNALGERLLVIADGMGGHRGGAEASRMCVQILEQRFLEQHDSIETRLRRGIDEANAEILRRGLEDSDLGGMGATCAALVLCPDGQAWIAWAGDSRVYRLRAQKFEQLSEDHSLVAEWQKLGVLTPAQASNHPKRNELTRAIGVTREVEPDLRTLELRAGDRFLLCSDGLSGVVDDATLAELLGSREPTAAARALVDLANSRGGPDNVTVQIAWLPDPAAAPASDPGRPADTDPWADFDLSDPETGSAPEAVSDEVSQARQQSFELTSRAPAAPQAQRASAASVRPAAAEPEPAQARRATSASAARRVVSIERGRLHPPSLVAGVLLGIALALVARAYLDGQDAEPAQAPAPVPTAAEPAAPEAAAAAALPPEPTAERTPEPVPLAAEARRAAPPADAAKPAPDRPAAKAERRTPPTPGSAEPARLVPVPEAVPTSAHFDVPEPVHRFLDAWLAALSADDATAHAALGFPTGASEFLRTQSSRESFRLVEVELSPRSHAQQTYLRVVLSYAFTNGAGRFRTEDELRMILDAGAEGLRFAGYWQE